MPDNNVTTTLDAVKAAQSQPIAPPDAIQKSFSQSTGLVAYDLAAPAAKLVPIITPLRKMTPRVVSTNGDTATRWKIITALNTTNTHAGISEGNRGAAITDAVASKSAAYAGIGLENFVTFEADYAAQSFDDAKARAVENLLYAGILEEERWLYGGNSALAFGQTPTPTVAKVAGGAITAGDYYVYCVALGYDAYRRATVGATGVVASISKTNTDSSSDTIPGGCAQVSAQSAKVTTETTNLAISAYVTPVRGAVGYAWYVGTDTNEKIAAITTINSVLLTALPAAGNQKASDLPAADKSAQGTYAFDGFLTTAVTAANGGYYKAMATGTAGTGTALSASGKGGITEIDDALAWFWDNLKMQPTSMVVHRQELNNISNKILAQSPNSFRFNATAGVSGQTSVVGGARVSSYASHVDGSEIPFHVSPYASPGVVLFVTERVPYALNNVGNLFQVKCRRDWYQLEWPLRSRKYEYGVYADEVFQHFFPASLGAITNITNG